MIDIYRWHWAPKICEPNTGELSESAEKKDNDFGSKEVSTLICSFMKSNSIFLK